MHRSRWFLLALSGVLHACVSTSVGAEPAPGSPAGHTWKPMADWYSPQLYVTKFAPRSVEQSELRMQLGDDARWSSPAWDDGGWEIVDRERVPLNRGIFWLRLRVRTTGKRERVPALLIVAGAAARDVFWDGVLIETTGVPGNSASTEIEGTSGTKRELALNATTTGEHVLAIRMSTFRSARLGARSAEFLVCLVSPELSQRADANLRLLPAMGVGAMLTMGIAVLVMWLLADRAPILAMFSVLCFSGALLVAIASAPYMWTYPASWAYYQSIGRVAAVVVIAGLLPAIGLMLLHPSWKSGQLVVPLLLVAAVAVCCSVEGLRSVNRMVWRCDFSVLLLLAGGAIWCQRSGGWQVMAGTALTFALFERDRMHFEHSGFLVGFLPILVGLIAGIALRLRGERLQARDTRLQAARLEIELLKKSLQPHFLMNTLTALSQVIEEKPAAAVRLIDDLALEFRSLTRFSSEKQVTIADELALCRAHLRVMSARTELPWSLQTEGIEETAAVPPALFLTLIENGFSHQRASESDTAFILRAERAEDRVRYIFFSPGTVLPDTHRVGGSTGLRYVRARLDESFHGAWKLAQGAVSGGWQTVVELHLPRREPLP